MPYSQGETSASTNLDCAGIVLLGGNSERMGHSKATLPFGPEPMGVRVVRILGGVTKSLIVVGAIGQSLPRFPHEVLIVRDRCPDRGPLEALAVGLRAAADHCEIAFVTGCDLPLLTPAFVQGMIELSSGFDVCLPCVDGRHEPLAAVYRVDVLSEVESLLCAGKLRPAFLLDRVRTRRVTADEISVVDPEMVSLTNINYPDQYRAALSKAGFHLPHENA